MKQIIITNILLIALTSCHKKYKPVIYFDTNKQKIIECSKYGLKNIYIDNDSVDHKGFLIEQQIQIKWEDNDNTAPNNITLNKIPHSYRIYKDNKIINKIELMKNSSYTISQAVVGKPIFSIRVKTNKDGIGDKTSQNKCK